MPSTPCARIEKCQERRRVSLRSGQSRARHKPRVQECQGCIGFRNPTVICTRGEVGVQKSWEKYSFKEDVSHHRERSLAALRWPPTMERNAGGRAREISYNVQVHADALASDD